MPVHSRDINAVPAQAIAKYTIISGSDPACHAEIEEVLKQHLRHELVKQAQRRLPTTYGRLAKMVTASYLGEIGIIGKTLEHLMQEDVYHDRPLVAALAVSSFGGGLPASWFFRKARDLGKFVGHCLRLPYDRASAGDFLLPATICAQPRRNRLPVKRQPMTTVADRREK